MAIDWEHQQDVLLLSQVGNLLCSHFGYAALAATGALFKVAVTATLASYAAFLVATLVGSFATYFPARLLAYGLNKAGFNRDLFELILLAAHLPASPVVGALILNAILGWGLALTPMLVVGGASLVFGLALVFSVDYYQKYKNSQERLENQVSSSVRVSGGSMFQKIELINGGSGAHNSYHSDDDEEAAESLDSTRL